MLHCSTSGSHFTGENIFFYSVNFHCRNQGNALKKLQIIILYIAHLKNTFYFERKILIGSSEASDVTENIMLFAFFAIKSVKFKYIYIYPSLVVYQYLIIYNEE